MRNLICKCTLNNNGRDLAKEGKVIRTSLVNFPNWPKKQKKISKPESEDGHARSRHWLELIAELLDQLGLVLLLRAGNEHGVTYLFVCTPESCGGGGCHCPWWRLGTAAAFCLFGRWSHCCSLRIQNILLNALPWYFIIGSLLHACVLYRIRVKYQYGVLECFNRQTKETLCRC